MKLLSIAILGAISLCAGFCCQEPEDDYPETITIENNTLISVANDQAQFDVGDAIHIITNVADQQEDISGSIINLSDYDHSEVNQSELQYRLSLYKLTGFGTRVKIPLLYEHIEIIEGDVGLEAEDGETNVTIHCPYDGVDYGNRIAITLLETGTYFLGPSYIFDNQGYIHMSGGDYNTSWISIRSRIQNSNDLGFFQFMVN